VYQSESQQGIILPEGWLSHLLRWLLDMGGCVVQNSAIRIQVAGGDTVHLITPFGTLLG
jgi:hypothetical protein